MNTAVDGPPALAFAQAAALSSATGGADVLAAVKQPVLDSVSSPLTRVMYARALEDFFTWSNTQGRPPFSRATVQAWRVALESKGLAPASVNQKLCAVRKLAAVASYNGLLRSGGGTGHPVHPRRRATRRPDRQLADEAADGNVARRSRSGD